MINNNSEDEIVLNGSDDLGKKNTKNKLITVRFSVTEKEKIDRITEKFKITKTAFIRKAVILYMSIVADTKDTLLGENTFHMLTDKIALIKKSIDDIEKKVKDAEKVLDNFKIPEEDLTRLIRNWLENLLV